jgi:hypothetical protein
MSTVIVRLFEPIAFVFAKEGAMPQDTTISIPPCIVCKEVSCDPPSRMGYIKTGGQTALFSVCGSCADCPDDELERRVVEKVSEPAMAE